MYAISEVSGQQAHIAGQESISRAENPYRGQKSISKQDPSTYTLVALFSKGTSSTL